MFRKNSPALRLCIVLTAVLGSPAVAKRMDTAKVQEEMQTVHKVQAAEQLHDHKMQKHDLKTNKHISKTKDDCSEAIEGAVARNKAWFKSQKCKCPDDQHIECPEGVALDNIRTFRASDLRGQGCTCEDGAPVQFKGDLSLSKNTCGSNFACNNIQVPMYGTRCCCVNLGGTVRPIDLVGSARNTYEAFCHGYHNNQAFNGFDWTQHCGVLCRGPTQRELDAFTAAIAGFSKEARDEFWNGMAGIGGLPISDEKMVTPYLPAHAAGRKEYTFMDELSDLVTGNYLSH